MLLCFVLVLQSLVGFFNTNVPYINTHRLKAKVKFPETFKSQKENNRNVIQQPGGLYWENLCFDLDLSTA